MLVAFSAVTTDNIPPDAKIVFGYANPPYAQLGEVHVHCPHAHIEQVVTHPWYIGELYDFENGALPIAEAGFTIRWAMNKGLRHPACYFALGNRGAVIDSLIRAGITRSDVRLVVAHYTPTPELPDWADGVQWTETALHRSLNQYQLRDDYLHWDPATQPPARRRF